MTHVFISYSRKDTSFVEKPERELKTRRMSVISDWMQL